MINFALGPISDLKKLWPWCGLGPMALARPWPRGASIPNFEALALRFWPWLHHWYNELVVSKIK